jgi:hypothetical protein
MAAANGVRGRAPGLGPRSWQHPPTVSARHSWMNRKAMAGPPHRLIRVMREGLSAGEVVGEGGVEKGGGVRGS